MKRVKFGKIVEETVVPTGKLQLHLTQEVYAEAQRVIAYAQDHVLTANAVQTEYDLEQLTGLRPVYPEPTTMEIPVGFHVMYRHELTQNGTAMRRLAIECPGEFAPPVACGAIMKLFGFINPPMNAKMWMRLIAKGRYSVNFVEPLDGDWSHFPDKTPAISKVLH